MYHHSMLFSMANEHRDYDEGGMYNSNSASVDCTLSLGTPSTRRTNETDLRQQRKRSSFMGSFGWNVKRSENTPTPHDAVKAHRGRSNVNVNSSSGGGGDPLLARRCANCDTTSTPLWRNGPRGPKSLCNACGIRFKKEERRATAASAAGNVGVHPVDTTQHHYAMGGAWTHHPHSYKTPPSYGDEFRFVEDNGVGVPFLSWRLNVTERPGLVYDLTR